jgi:hypothetical protein
VASEIRTGFHEESFYSRSVLSTWKIIGMEWNGMDWNINRMEFQMVPQNF